MTEVGLWLAKFRRAELPSANNPPFIPARKENSHEAGCTKKCAEAQATKEAPGFEKGRSGEEIKRNGSVASEPPSFSIKADPLRPRARLFEIQGPGSDQAKLPQLQNCSAKIWCFRSLAPHFPRQNRARKLHVVHEARTSRRPQSLRDAPL